MFSKSSNNPEPDFFLPELCLPQALLVLIVLAQLLVFVLVLAEPMNPGFNWVRLALTSLFVQWIVLLSAAMLCAHGWRGCGQAWQAVRVARWWWA